MNEIDARDVQILNALQGDGRLFQRGFGGEGEFVTLGVFAAAAFVDAGGFGGRDASGAGPEGGGYPGTAYVFITLDGQDRKKLDAFEAKVNLVPQI